MSRSIPIRFFEAGLWLTAFLCLGWVVGVWLEAAQTRRHVDEALAAGPPERHEALPASVPALAAGDPIGRLRIPDAGIDAAVLEGDGDDVLRRAVGHLPDTRLPGAGGSVALAGHRDSFFRNLRHAEPGQRIELETPWGRFDYRIHDAQVVEADALWVLDDPVAGEVLTLITCHPFDWIGPAPDRFVVRATRVLAINSDLRKETIRTTEESETHGPTRRTH